MPKSNVQCPSVRPSVRPPACRLPSAVCTAWGLAEANTENAFATRTVNLETDKSHSEKRALVRFEQKKLKGFKLTVPFVPPSRPSRRLPDQKPMTKPRRRRGTVCIWRCPLLFMKIVFRATCYTPDRPQLTVCVCVCACVFCESFLTTEKLCKLWLNNGRRCCDFSALISMI